MERAVFVYTTYPSIVEAEKAGRALLERALAACVNILPGMVSLYRWQGAIERGEEAVMIVKTRASLAEAVRAAVKEMHSYETPAILVIPLESVDICRDPDVAMRMLFDPGHSLDERILREQFVH